MRLDPKKSPSQRLDILCASRGFFPFPLVWFCLIALIISLLTPLLIAQSDIWFHLRNARQLLATHSFLRTDSYTFTTPGAALLNHEWLAELPYYLAYQSFGLRGMAATNTLVLCLVFGGVYYLSCRRGADCSDAALMIIAVVLLSLSSSGPRMDHFGYLCLVLLMITLERFQQTGKSAWVIPPLFTVWINFHGSWVFGLVIVGIYTLSGLVKKQQGRIISESWKPGQLCKLLLATAASLATLLVNPYGYKLVWYPFDLLLRQQANLGNVVEWQSVDFHTLNGKMALSMLFLVLGVGLLSERKWAVRDLLMLSFALWSALNHVRFLSFAAIIVVPILSPKLQICPTYDPGKDNCWRNLAAALPILVLLLWAFPTSDRLQRAIDKAFPREALHYMEQTNITGPLFHRYDFGGYIEMNAPQIKTFADGRTDIFVYSGVFDDYLQASHTNRLFEILDKYKINYVLYTPNTSLTYLLDHSSEWRVIYIDSVAALYQRVTGAPHRN